MLKSALSPDIEATGKVILDSAYKVHTALGAGLLESAYEACLLHELNKQGLECKKQIALPIQYDNQKIETGYRIDLLVNNRIIIELKSVEALTGLHTAQLFTYLKLSKLRLGFLINFNTTHLKDGIKRVVN